jgi:hypothetical protein
MDQRTSAEELDHRQDHVLQQLAELNARVESLVNVYLRARDPRARDVGASEPTKADSPNGR